MENLLQLRKCLLWILFKFLTENESLERLASTLTGVNGRFGPEWHVSKNRPRILFLHQPMAGLTTAAAQ